MGFIYQIKVNNELYIGSTKQKYLSSRQGEHNKCLNNQNNKNYNNPLYRFCRTHNIEKIICELIVEADNNELKILEQEYMNKLNPKLNTYRAYRTEEELKEQIRLKNNKKSNCPICDKEMNKNYINRHIKSHH